jgi:phosphoglycolate phosphatase-like HAD superfamily hydrolase
MHVIWDWNGTLLDDFPVVIEAVNVALVELGGEAIEPDAYRDHYTRPVQRFYERLMQRPITAAEWRRIDDSFHSAYSARMHQAPLARDGAAALEQIARLGATQSLLSMLRQDELFVALDGRGVREHMLRVDGLVGGGGDQKAPHMLRHLADVRAARGVLEAHDCVVIGDSLDDARAARELGLSCVLYDGGSHHRAELEQSGVPVTDSLLHALALCGLG